MDEYSFSFIVWEMVTDEFPYDSFSKMDFIDVFLGGAMDELDRGSLHFSPLASRVYCEIS